MATEPDDRYRFQGVPKLPIQRSRLGDEQLDLWDSLSEQAEALPPGPERDEVLYAMRRFSDTVREAVQGPEEFGNLIITKGFVDSRGRNAVEEKSDMGHVRVVVKSKEESEGQRAEVKAIVDKRDDARTLLLQARNRRALAFDAANAGSTDAASQLEREADALQAQAQKTLDTLREVVPEADWESYELGRPPEPLKEGVGEALELLHAGKVEELKGVLVGLDAGAKYQFMGRVPKEDEHFVDLLLQTSPEEDAAIARNAGWS